MYRRSLRRHALAGIVAAVVAVTGAVAALPPAGADIPRRRIVSGWLPYWTMTKSLESVTNNASLWSDASPFWYQATGATTIGKHTGAGDQTVVAALRSRGILVLPTVTETLNGSAMAKLLSDASQRTAHVQTLASLVTANGYDGIDLDYESMNYGGTSAEMETIRVRFVDLVRELGAALDAKGKLLSVTVGARTATTNWWPIHDYPGLGQVADRFRIMAYDYSYPGGTPGPIAPLGWVEQVVSYAVTVVPPSKIQLGAPLYGYDWPQDPAAQDGWGTASSLSYTSAEALRTSVGATRQWSSTHAAPYFSYVKDGVTHQVWYNDADSTKAKTALIDKYRIKGLAFWAVGYEDTRQWPALREYATPPSTKITAAAPSLVTYGTVTTVSGELTTLSGAAVAGASVQFQYYDSGSMTWRTAATGTTSSTGTVAFPYTPSVTRSYRLYAPSSRSHLGSTSSVVTTQVAWRVAATFAPSTISSGMTAALRGSVGPVRAGTTVFYDRLMDNSWTAVGSTTVAADGSYSFSVTGSIPGTYTYRVRAPGTTLNATGYSPTTTLTVT